MTKRSVFRDFIISLRKHWRRELPEVRPIEENFGPRMPKASTFYAGVAPRLSMHVFVNFQHSSKSWEVGRFTVNLMLSKREGAPDTWGGPFAPDDGTFTEGSYRISSLLGSSKDKWWHLKPDTVPTISEAWRPTSYDDYDQVLSEAATDVTRDVRAALAKLGL